MRKSAGVVIILKNKRMLLIHPTNHKWTNSFSFPKGGIEKDEKKIDAAIRELREETSIVVNKDQIINPKEPIVVKYEDRKGNIYKKVYLFVVNIEDVSEIGLDSDVVPKELLQEEEVDWAGFLDKDEAKDRIFFRVKHLLKLIN